MIERDVTQIDSLEYLADEVLEIIQARGPEEAVVLAFHGDLGAGKTTFIQLLAKKLGVVETVTSPTFMLMKMYLLPVQYNKYDEVRDDVFLKFVHADVYRIEEIDEMRVLGFEKLLAEKGSIICIEWAEKVAEMLPQNVIDITFTLEGERRSVTISHEQTVEQ